MIVLDTTVLVYATGAEHPLREPCRRLVEAIGDGRLAATTTVEVIQEYAHLRARRVDRRDAADRAADFVTLLSPLLRPNEDDVRRGLEIFAATDALDAVDAVLAASVLNGAHLTGLVSADPSFAGVAGLAYRAPGEVVV